MQNALSSKQNQAKIFWQLQLNQSKLNNLPVCRIWVDQKRNTTKEGFAVKHQVRVWNHAKKTYNSFISPVEFEQANIRLNTSNQNQN